jgi:hypothetical protein
VVVIINVTDFNPHHFEQALEWLKTTTGEEIFEGDGTVLLSADTWRIYKTESSIEGYYETTWFLEFDSAADGTAFLLRWS